MQCDCVQIWCDMPDCKKHYIRHQQDCVWLNSVLTGLVVVRKVENIPWAVYHCVTDHEGRVVRHHLQEYPGNTFKPVVRKLRTSLW